MSWGISRLKSRVRQTDFTPSRGNALQACVASLLNMPLDQVPNFVTLPDYEQGIREFLKDTPFSSSKRPISELYMNDDNMLCILRGKSPRGDFGHVVIARVVNADFEMVHDPHPDDTFLENYVNGWFMTFYAEEKVSGMTID